VADCLKECQVTTVVMESTGVYWIPVFQILEARGFDVVLVNARHMRSVPGRKSDVADCVMQDESQFWERQMRDLREAELLPYCKSAFGTGCDLRPSSEMLAAGRVGPGELLADSPSTTNASPPMCDRPMNCRRSNLLKACHPAWDEMFVLAEPQYLLLHVTIL